MSFVKPLAPTYHQSTRGIKMIIPVWTSDKIRQNHAILNLDIIFGHANLGNIQSIKYESKKLYVISENQYKKLQILP